MEFIDRVGWVLLGMALGYIIRLLQDMKKEVDEMDEIIVKNKRSKKDEGGFVLREYAGKIAIALALAMTLYATVSTGSTNNKLESAISDIKASQEEDVQIQLKLARVTVCTQEYLAKTITALNERTEFTQEQSDANVDLQKAQNDFLRIFILQPPATPDEVDVALDTYLERLQAFVDVAKKNRKNVNSNAYPKPEELRTCLNTPTPGELDNPDDKVAE